MTVSQIMSCFHSIFDWFYLLLVCAGCIWSCVEVVKKATVNQENRTYLVKKMNFLPILAKVSHIFTDKNEQKSLLNLIQDLCLKNKIKSGDGFVTDFLSHLVSTILADDEDVNTWHHSNATATQFDFNKWPIFHILQDLGKCALSVLIHMCHKNMFISQVLKNKTAIDELRKMLTVERYGILVSIGHSLLWNQNSTINSIWLGMQNEFGSKRHWPRSQRNGCTEFFEFHKHWNSKCDPVSFTL